MEETLVQTLGDDAVIKANFGGRDTLDFIFSSGALGIGENEIIPDKPYIAWRELPSSPFRVVEKGRNSQLRRFLISVNDHRGDFGFCNEVLREIRRVVKAMHPMTASDGTWIYDSRWEGISENITDEQYDTSVKYGTASFAVDR